MPVKTSVFMLSVLAAVSIAAHAETPAPAAHRGAIGFREACGEDMKKYCPDIADQTARRACFAKNLSKFTPACQSYHAKHPFTSKPPSETPPAASTPAPAN